MRTVITYILMLTGVMSAWSQTDSLDSLLLEVMGDDKEIMRLINPPTSYCYLYGGIGGDSKSHYAGREIGDDMYNVNGNIFFFHSKGYFIGASGTWYSQTDPGYSNTIFTAGFSKSINQKKSLFLRASYSRYLYHNSNPDTVNAFTNNLAAGITLRNKWIGGRLSFNFLFGTDYGINLRPEIFLRIPVLRFGKYNKIQMEPDLSFFVGSETVEYENAGNLNNNLPDSQSSTSTEIVYGLLNTQFYLPACIYVGDFDIELGYSVNIPRSQDQSIDYPVSSFFTVSLGYLIALN